jgi:hypothetical protein
MSEDVDTILKITHQEAKPFIEIWHYSKIVPAGKNIFFGWYINNNLYAVANYGIGVNTYQASFLHKQTGFNVTNDNLVELKRLCRSEPKKDTYHLTKFISKCHKKLKQLGYYYVVSFSDPEHNHTGGIYRAANFINLGKTRPEIHFLNENKEFVHRRIPRHYQKRNNIDFRQAVIELGLTPRKTQPKDRWFIKL